MSTTPIDSHQSRSPGGLLRPWTFSASTTPVVLGAVLSYRSEGGFRPDLFFLTLGAVLSVNGAGNMVNSYFELIRQSRTMEAHNSGRDMRNNQRRHLSSEGKSPDNEIAHSKLVDYAAYLYFFGMVCLLCLMTLSPAKSQFLAGLFFGGLSSSFVYTGGIGLKYYILGDILVMFTFGPLAVLFSYLVQTGTISVGPLLLALPLAVSTEAILHSKHIRDMEEDNRANMVSLAVLLGKQGSYLLFTMLLFTPYIAFVIFGTQYSLYLVLPLLSMPYAFSLERKLREQGPSRSISTGAARLNVTISVLFTIGCMLTDQIPFIDLWVL